MGRKFTRLSADAAPRPLITGAFSAAKLWKNLFTIYNKQLKVLNLDLNRNISINPPIQQPPGI